MTTRVSIRNMKHAFSATAGETELEVQAGEMKAILPPGEEREFFVEDEGLKLKEKKVKNEDEKPGSGEPEPAPVGAAMSKKAPSPGLADPYPSGASRK